MGSVVLFILEDEWFDFDYYVLRKKCEKIWDECKGFFSI